MGGPPMGGPPMGGPPQMQPPRAQVVRKGTSKMVPIVVSAGLAIGTFCGLLFGLGTGADEAIAEPSKGDNVKKDEKDKDMTMEGSKVTDPGTPKIDKPKPTQVASTGSAAAPASGSAATGSGAAPAAGSGAAPAAGSGAAPAAGSGAAPAAGSGAAPAAGSAAPAVKMAKLTIEVTPEGAAKDVTITIDKKEITGMTSDIELGKDGKKSVVLTVKSSGYHSVSNQKVEVDGDMTVKIEMKKKASSPSLGPRPGGKKDGKSSKKTGGGLIDI